MGEYEFVIRTSNKEKIKVFSITVAVLILLIMISSYVGPKLFNYWTSDQGDSSTIKIIKDKLTDISPTGIFMTSFFGGSLFIPMPIELFYWLGLENGSNILLSFALVNIGFITMQFINYWLGLKLSYFFFTFVSKRKVYAIRRKVNKYGSWAVFLLNVTPSPSELLTFALGITRYNKTRLFVVLALANIIKFSIITIIFILIR